MNNTLKRLLSLAMAVVMVMSYGVMPVSAAEGEEHTHVYVEGVCGCGTACTHEGAETSETSATCTSDGAKTFICGTCGVTDTQTVPAAGHTYADGKCTVCGADEPPAHVHSFGDGVVEPAATCGTDGILTKTCECGETETEVILATGEHNYENGVCTVCTAEDPNYVSPDAGHTHEWNQGEVTLEALCTDTGVMTYTCLTGGCGETKTETIPAQCTDETHAWECPFNLENPANRCTLTEGCQLVKGHLGDCTGMDTFEDGTVTTLEALQAAIDAGGTVKLGADIEFSGVYNDGQTIKVPTSRTAAAVTVTLDLNGHTLTQKNTAGGGTSAAAIAIRPGSTLTVVDTAGNGTIKACNCAFQNEGTLNIQGGTIIIGENASNADKSADLGFAYGVWMYMAPENAAAPTVNMTGGSIQMANKNPAYGEAYNSAVYVNDVTASCYDGVTINITTTGSVEGNVVVSEKAKNNVTVPADVEVDYYVAPVEVDTLEELQTALASESEAEIIVTAPITVPAGNTVELDLNGKTVNLGANYIENNGTLTVQNGSLIAATYNSTTNGAPILNKGNLTVNANLTGVACIIRTESGEVTVTGGYYIMSGAAGKTCNMIRVKGGTVTVNGGTFTATKDGTDSTSIVSADSGTTTLIAGGSFSGYHVNSILSGQGSITVKGGTFENGSVAGESTVVGLLNERTADGFKAVADGNVVKIEDVRVAFIGEQGYTSLLAALNAAMDTGAPEIKLVKSTEEVMPDDFEIELTSDLTITADEAVTAEFYNNGTTYDFTVDSANDGHYTFTIGENVTFKLRDRVIWLGYSGNDVDVVVNGTLSGSQIWHGADTTVNSTGILISSGEALVMRRGATLTVNSGTVNANYFSVAAGNIDAKNAKITCGALWVDNTSKANEGSVKINLDNTTFTSTGNVKLVVPEGNTAVVNVTNGSKMTLKKHDGYAISEVDKQSAINVSNATVEIEGLTLNGSLNVESNGTAKITGDVTNNNTINVNGGSLEVTGTLTNNGTVAVKGNTTLNIPTLSGTAIYVVDDATLTNSAVGGNIYAGYGANKTDSLELTIAGTLNAKALYVGDKTIADYYTNGEVHKLTIQSGADVTVGTIYVRPTCVATVTNATVKTGDLYVRGTMTVDGSTMTKEGAASGTGHWAIYENDDTTKTASLTLNNSTVSTNYIAVGSENANDSTAADGNAKLTVNGGALTLNNLYVHGSDTFKDNAATFLNGAKLTAAEATVTSGATLSAAIGTEVNATNITGAGTILVDGTGFTGGDAASPYGTSNIKTFTGTVTDNSDLLFAVRKEIDDSTARVVLTTAVAQVGDEYFPDLQSAVNAANGKTVTLLKETAEVINVPEGHNVTIDLNKKTLTGSILAPNATLTVENGTIKNTNASVSAIEINAGTLNLNGVDIESARHAVRIDGSVTATINGGTYKVPGTAGTTTHAVNVSGAADVTIKSGTFIGPSGTVSDSGAAVNVQADAKVTIKGGDFSGGKNNTLASAGTLTLTGGTYDQDPTAYCAEGYVAKETNAKWEVITAGASVTTADGTTTYYYSLADAAAAAAEMDGDVTITQLDDAREGTNAEPVPISGPATIENLGESENLSLILDGSDTAYVYSNGDVEVMSDKERGSDYGRILIQKDVRNTEKDPEQYIFVTEDTVLTIDENTAFDLEEENFDGEYLMDIDDDGKGVGVISSKDITATFYDEDEKPGYTPVVKQGERVTLIAVSTGFFDSCTEIWVDSERVYTKKSGSVNESYFLVSEGCTELELTGQFVKTLPAGKHSVKFVHKIDGKTYEPTVTFKVTSGSSKADPTNPKTGDFILMPMTIMTLSTAALAVLLLNKKKHA